MMRREAIELYGLQPVAQVHIADEIFHVEVSDAGIAAEECCIYAFLVGGQIVRIGSSKGRLAKRLRAWQNDISRALQGRKSPAPQIEADKWRALLLEYGVATIYARRGSTRHHRRDAGRPHLNLSQ